MLRAITDSFLYPFECLCPQSNIPPVPPGYPSSLLRKTSWNNPPHLFNPFFYSAATEHTAFTLHYVICLSPGEAQNVFQDCITGMPSRLPRFLTAQRQRRDFHDLRGLTPPTHLPPSSTIKTRAQATVCCSKPSPLVRARGKGSGWPLLRKPASLPTLL